MFQVFGTLCCFSSRSFLKQLASHVSADTLQLKFQGIGGLEGEYFCWGVSTPLHAMLKT